MVRQEPAVALLCSNLRASSGNCRYCGGRVDSRDRIACSVGQWRAEARHGQEIYMAGCVSCHGRTGKGQAANLGVASAASTFPDFADCPGATPEPDIQWRAVITTVVRGGVSPDHALFRYADSGPADQQSY